jgi:hypothetical protein
MIRFTIRDVLWLTALVAMGLGWGLDNRASVRQRKEFKLTTLRLEQGLKSKNKEATILRFMLNSSRKELDDRKIANAEANTRASMPPAP